MPKDSLTKSRKQSSSKKITPAITVAVIALLGTVVTALLSSPVLIAWIQRTPEAPSVPTKPPSDSSEIANPLPSASIPSISEGDEGCLTQYFANIEPASQISIEVGVNAQDYYFPSQNLSNQNFIGPMGIRLTQNGKMIAALSFLFFTDGHLFKITSAVDSNCQTVAEYSNASRGGDPNAIQNDDTLKIQLTEGSFSLQFHFSGTDYFRFNFQQLQ